MEQRDELYVERILNVIGKQLAERKDEAQRQTLLKLLAAEGAKDFPNGAA
jgi:hypothetical protein